MLSELKYALFIWCSDASIYGKTGAFDGSDALLARNLVGTELDIENL